MDDGTDKERQLQERLQARKASLQEHVDMWYELIDQSGLVDSVKRQIKDSLTDLPDTDCIYMAWQSNITKFIRERDKKIARFYPVVYREPTTDIHVFDALMSNIYDDVVALRNIR